MAFLLKQLLIDKNNNSMIQFLRSLVVGGIATVVDIGVLTALVEWANVNLILATALGFIAGLIVNFFISSLWVFNKSQVVKNRFVEFIVFGFIGVIGLLINEAIVLFFELYLSPKEIFSFFLPSDKYYILGKLTATVVAFVWNFAARKLFLYRNSK